jgi:response regulator RpfG family c-di-GMP phosphodiesterase
MTEKVLFVDDEPNVLEAIQRTLRKRVVLQTATGGAEGLQLLRDEGPFAVVISDMRMPEMNGAQFLSKVREQSPEAVRMILSGQADLEATIAAVNDGNIYRFLSKPCTPDRLFAAIEAGLEQYRLVRLEKTLLEQTLGGAVKMLVEILGMVSPAAYSRASRVQRYVNFMISALQLPERWQWPLAALVSQIGCVALPKELLSKVAAGQPLSGEEAQLYASHPEIAARLLAAIPRLEEVSAMVAAQCNRGAVPGQPANLHDWNVSSLGQLLVYTACEFDRLMDNGLSSKAAIEELRTPARALPVALLDVLSVMPRASQQPIMRQIELKDLAPGMVLDEDLVSSKGIRLVPAGNEVTRSLIIKLTSVSGGVGVKEPFRVRVQT